MILGPIWITENIAVGSAPESGDLEMLKQQGVNAIIDMRAEATDDETLIRKLNMRYLNIKVNDGFSPTQEQTRTILKFADSILTGRGKIFVHCQNGYGRSTLTVTTILRKRGMTADQALKLLGVKHPGYGFTKDQRDYFNNLNGY